MFTMFKTVVSIALDRQVCTMAATFSKKLDYSCLLCSKRLFPLHSTGKCVPTLYKTVYKQASNDKMTKMIVTVERIRLNALLVIYFRIQNCR